MQPRIVTLYTVLVGFCRQTRWIVNRQFIKNLPLKTLLAIRSGEISEKRLLYIVNAALNCGIHVSKDNYDLETIFFEVYNKVAHNREFDKEREFRFSLDTL